MDEVNACVCPEPRVNMFAMPGWRSGSALDFLRLRHATAGIVLEHDFPGGGVFLLLFLSPNLLSCSVHLHIGSSNPKLPWETSFCSDTFMNDRRYPRPFSLVSLKTNDKQFVLLTSPVHPSPDAGIPGVRYGLSQMVKST